MRGDDQVIASGGKGQYMYTISRWAPCKVERVLEDRDEVELGGTTLVARLTPGHNGRADPGGNYWHRSMLDRIVDTLPRKRLRSKKSVIDEAETRFFGEATLRLWPRDSTGRISA